MNDWQKMDYHASSGEWDQALALASKLKHQGALAVLAGNFQIPPSHINSFLERMPRNDIPGTIYELSENLHPDLSSDDLHKIWKHVSGDYLTTKNIIEHPNFKGADAGQKAAGEFWNSYETKVNPSHFAAIKSALTGEPESLETHRGIGHSSAHELQIPHLIKHMESSQQAILKDPTIPKQYVNGEPHIVVYRGVGGSYAKAIKNGFGIKDELNEGGPKSTIERHKTVNVPSTHMASWSIDKKMAVRFAGARGDHDSVGNPHHVIIKKLVPVRAVLHSGMHSLYPGHQLAHIGENEVVLMHPSASYKVSSKDVEVGHPEKTGLVLPESFKPLEKKTAIKKSSDPLAPLIQQAKANLAAVHKVASQEPRPMLFGGKNGSGRHGFVSLDPSKPNQWRVTHFVKGQPSGHTEADSFSDAIKKAHSYGYNVSKELFEEDMSKGQSLEKANTSDSDYLYHVTTLANANKIGQQGLRPQGGKGIGAAGLGSHKSEHVFLTSGQGVPFWHSRAVDFAEHHHDDPVSSYHIPVVLRIHKDKLKGADVQPDELGSEDAREPAFKVKGLLRGEDFEHWDGNQWSKIKGSSLMSPAFAALGHDEDGYLLKENKLIPPEHMRKSVNTPTLEDYLKEQDAFWEKYNKVSSQEPRSMIFADKDKTRHGFITPDPSNKGGWRVTHFVKGALRGHTEVPTFKRAIEEAHAHNYNIFEEVPEEEVFKLEKNKMNKSEDFSRVSSVVVATDDKMLMLQRRDNSKWTFPGGHLNDDETHLEGAVRELWEEAGIRANPDEMILLGNKKTFQNKNIHVYLYIVNSEVKPSAANDPDKEAQKFAWLPHVLPEDIKENLYIPVGDNSSLSMFSVWLLRQKTNKLKELVESKKSV